MDFTLFGSCLIKKIGVIFVHFSTLMSTIYGIFIYVLDDNIASVVLCQNLGNLKTNATKIPVLVLQKLSLLDSSFLDCFIQKKRQFVQFHDFQRVISRKVEHNDIFYFLS